MYKEILLRSGNLPIEGRYRRVFVRNQPQVADSYREHAEDIPADKAQLETEQPHTVSFHHFLGRRDGFACGHLRMLRKYILCHRVAVVRHDAWNHQEEGPQENIDRFQDSSAYRIGPIRRPGQRSRPSPIFREGHYARALEIPPHIS